MAETPNLDLLLMEVGAPGREVIVNDGLAVLDSLTSGVLALDLAGSGDYVLTDTIQGEAKYGVLRLTGVLTGARTLIVPAKGRQYLIENQTTGAFTLTVKPAAGTGVTLDQDTWGLLVCDGTNVFATVTGGAGGTLPTASETTAGIIELATTAEATAGTDPTRAITPATLQGRLSTLTVPAASETVAGSVELATTAEVATGTDALRAVTPAGLQAKVAALPVASTSAVGLIELATSGEVTAGTDALRAVTPATLVSRTATETLVGLVELATTVEATTGTDTTRAVTAAGLQAKINTLSGLGPASEASSGIVELATQIEVNTGSDDLRAVTPLKLATRLTAVLPPAASETVPGVVELATAAETTTGTDTTRAITPAALAAKVPAGTPLSVARYAASGQALEGSPATISANGDLTVHTTGTASTLTLISEHSTTTGALTLEAYTPGSGSPSFAWRKALGTPAAPGRVTTVGSGALNLSGQVWVRNATDTADAWQGLGSLRAHVESVDAQGRIGGYLALWTAPGVSQPQAEALRVTQAGNLLLGTTTHGTSLAKGLVLGSGTAPTTSPADGAQLWVADRGGVAGKASLHVRTEDGTSHILGDLSGMGTLCDASLGSGSSYQALNVKGSVLHVGQSSVQERPMILVDSTWATSTDATRKARLTLSVYDAGAAREGLRLETSGTAALLGFFGQPAVVRQTVPAAATDAGTTQTLANTLRTALINLGLCS